MEPVVLEPMTEAPAQKGPVIEIPVPGALEQRANRANVQADSIVVTNEDEYGAAAEALKDIKVLDKEIAEWFAPHVKRAHEAHKALKNSENTLRDPLKRALNLLGRKMGKYQADLEQQRRLEREMILAQQKAAADAAAMELAEGLAENGDMEAAEGVLAQAAKMQPEVNCESIAPKVRGTAVRTTWHFVIENVDLIPRKYTIPNLAMLNAEAQACQENTNIPGGRAVSETKVSARV